MLRTEETLLQMPITELPLSPEFKQFCQINQFSTLSEVLQHHSSELIKLPESSLPLLYEYVRFLESKGLGQLIDPI